MFMLVIAITILVQLDNKMALPSPSRVLERWALWNPLQHSKQKQQSSFAECLVVTCPAQSGDVTVWSVRLQDRKNLLEAPVIFTDFLLPSLVTKGVMAETVSQREFQNATNALVRNSGEGAVHLGEAAHITSSALSPSWKKKYSYLVALLRKQQIVAQQVAVHLLNSAMLFPFPSCSFLLSI